MSTRDIIALYNIGIIRYGMVMNARDRVGNGYLMGKYKAKLDAI
jgi:hypothetical protein